jgi:hypothetical protein
MNRIIKNLSVAFTLALLAGPVVAQNQYKGHVINIDGQKCTFSQTTSAESYLHSLQANTGHLVFDNPSCMSAKGLALDVNKMMIANFITGPYAQPDASFETRTGEFKKSSALQVRGICIQSATYPNLAVVAEFQINGEHISGVKHAMAVQGCKG